MPALPSLPRSAEVYSADQRREIKAAVTALRRLWRRMGGDFDASWLTVAPQMLQVLDTAQERVAAGSLAFVPAVLAETRQRLHDTAYQVDPAALVGTAGDGRPTEDLLYGGVIHAKEAVSAGASASEALTTASNFITLAGGTALSDTGRTAEKMAGHARRVTGYVRMLTPPSCGRCVVLAGSWTSSRTAFDRHPGCDCRNIPAAESMADDYTVSPEGYLSSLDDAELARALGSKANAEAFRDGADPIQLINAYRSGIRSAQTFDGRIRYTVEGTTRQGVAYRAMRAASEAGRRVTRTRLMPETIYARARNRGEALQMLRDYGWIRSPLPGFTISGSVATRVS